MAEPSTWPFQPHNVLFIDGPCRGQRMAIKADANSVTMTHIEESRWIGGIHYEDKATLRPRMRQTHYCIHRYHERHGVLARCMRVASVEARFASISKHDLIVVEIMIRRIPWSAGPEPSFLYNFDRWIVWAAYKNDAGSRSFRNWVESGGASWKLWTYYRVRYR